MTVPRVEEGELPRDRPPVLGDISVLIPTLGRPVLESSLASIAGGDAWPACLVVVDQSSSPAIAALLEELSARGLATEYVPSRKTGRSAGLNRGFERVSTSFVAVTDDDCLVERDWLRRMRESLEAHPDSVVSGRVEAVGEEAAVAVVTDTRPAVYHRPRLSFDAMSGGNMGTSLEVVARVGPFEEDPRLRLAEDCDWSYRALRAGVPIVYAPEVCLRHLGWRDGEERVAHYRAYARSHGGFYGKHLRRGDLFIALRAANHLLRASRRWLRGVLSGDRDRRSRGWAYMTGLVPGILAGLRRAGEERGS